MGSSCLSKCKSCLFIFMMLHIFMVGRIQGVCIEDEKQALLEIKASLNELANFYGVDNPLSTWVDHGSSKCCDWERIKCATTAGYVTHLSLSNMFGQRDSYSDYQRQRWSLNFSPFLRFKELRSLDLSNNDIDATIATTGLERLYSLKKLEILNLSTNYIQSDILRAFGRITSLKVLDLRNLYGLNQYPPPHDISELFALENLEVLDLTGCSYHGTLQMQGSETVSTALRKLKVLNLGWNKFNESLLPSLSSLRSLKTLDLSTVLSGSFPIDIEVFSYLTSLEKLDLSNLHFIETPSIQGCKSLTRLKNLEIISLAYNHLNASIISCLSFLPSLKILDLSHSQIWGGFFLMQELSSLRKLKTLDLNNCGLHSLRFNELHKLPDLEVLLMSGNNFGGTLPMEDLKYLHHLEVLDLSYNDFVGSIPSTIKALYSLKVASFAYNNLNGSLCDHELWELKNLRELDLSNNMFDGKFLECFNTLSSLELFDISSNLFTGKILPSVIANLTSIKYIDFSHNKFEGTFSFSSFSSSKKLEVVAFINHNDKLVVETEEPIGWTPMFRLKSLVLSNCSINRLKGSVVPTFLLHQTELKELDMSHNSLRGEFPYWLINNNTMLEVLSLRNNLFGGNFSLAFNTNYNTRSLDMSGNNITGDIPRDIQKFLPHIVKLNLSRNSLHGVIPSSVGDLSMLEHLDLSHNALYGEVPTELFTSLLNLSILKLSSNNFHGEILSRKLNWCKIQGLHLDSNSFTGKIGSQLCFDGLRLLDISNNFFTGLLPVWISGLEYLDELVIRNNSLGGPFPCGTAPSMFLDISKNNFSGPVPSCLNFQTLRNLHLGSNKFTGSIPGSFSNLTDVLILDIGNNYLSGRIPKFLGELSNLRILILRKNNFSGSIPKELCMLTNASLIDLSSNFLSGSIPSCLQNITGPSYQVFMQKIEYDAFAVASFYRSLLFSWIIMKPKNEMLEIQDQVMFTTKALSLTYKGKILDVMSGLDLSCNKLTGGIPEELGFLTQIHVLNLSHNMLSGPIPNKFSNLTNMESLDLSSNSLTGKVPSELIDLKYLSIFNVSFNNLSGRLPEMKSQFSTFTKASYEGNPLLCGPPLENKCTTGSRPANEHGTDDKWYHMDMASFYGSCGSTWFVFMLGFVALLYINPYWRRKWLDLVEECMYTCYYFLFDSSRKLFMLFRSMHS